MTAPGEVGEALSLLLACAGEPVPVDRLADAGCWRPSVLLSTIEALRGRGLVGIDADRSELTWLGDRDAVIASASDADFSVLAAAPSLFGWLLDGARRAASEHRFSTAAIVYRHLSEIEPGLRASFPGGTQGWVAMVLESVRLLRAAWGANPALLDAAVALAEESGDLASQAALLAARGVRFLPGDPETARQFFDRSLEAAEAVGDPDLRAEVRRYMAASLTLSGRPREGICAFEALIGDVQGDLLEPESSVLLDMRSAEPASPAAMLALAYATVGEQPRATDLMQRVVELGTRLGNRALQAQGQGVLAFVAMSADDPDAAARWAEAAIPWYAENISPYTWGCTVALAWSRAATQPGEAHAILAQALPVWQRTRRIWVGGSKMLELLERLQSAGLPQLDGLTVEGEVARHLDAPQPAFAGVAHRWAAKRASNPVQARQHLAESVRLLRQAGVRPELELALKDALDLARNVGDSNEQRALDQELDSGASTLPRTHGLVRLANAVLEMGRLGALTQPNAGLWGDLAARLCRELGAERCVLVTQGEAGLQTIRAARGSPSWCKAVLEQTRDRAIAAPVFQTALAPGFSERAGQLVLIPFDDGGKHRGLVAIENRDTSPQVGPADEPLLVMLGRQIGIVLANVELWQQLADLRQRLEQENRYYRESAHAAPFGSGRIVGDSTAMREVLELVRRVAPSRTPVLVTGETGVGKELISREVHLASPRRDGPFIAVNIASLSPALVASALFGHERGAFTGATQQSKGRFELAHGGTLFLDEVGELSPDDQVRLLRVLQEGTFERVGGSRSLSSDFRLVTATNRDLLASVKEGRFREDLYYRLAAFPIRVPPLRERREEIPTLALFFLERASRKLGLTFEGISEGDMERLCQCAWPGNVRELEHVIERAALLSDPPRLRIGPLDLSSLPATGPASCEPPAPEQQDWVSLEEAERRHVRRVLHHVRGRISGAGGAAEILCLKPTTLHFWIDRLDLRAELAKARSTRPRKTSDA